MAERYKRNRAALAAKAHVSPSALSQYVRGRATPSLDVLVHLADALDVSLDHLVFGDLQPSTGADGGYFATQLDEGIRKAQRDAANLYDLVARLGARLGDRVREVAEEFVPDVAQTAGSLTADEVAQVERCSLRTAIVTSSLALEVLVAPGALGGERGEAAAPGLFADTIVANIRDGHAYEYFLPESLDLGPDADLLRQQIIDLSGLSPSDVDALLVVYGVPRSCVPGYVMHTVSIPLLQERAPAVADRVNPFLSASQAAGEGYLATVEPASRSYRHYAMLDAASVPLVHRELDQLRRPHQATPTS